jgi:hypothetical protein
MKNKINLRNLAFILAISGIGLIFSCQKNDLALNNISEEILLNPKFSGPLIFGKLSLDDVIELVNEDSIVYRYEDSLLYVLFSDTLEGFSVEDEVIDIPDQVFIEEYIEAEITINPLWIASNKDDTVLFQKMKEEEWTFDNNERLDSLQIKSLNLVIDVTSSFEHTGILDISTENLTIDGEPFSHQVVISEVSGNFSSTETINLDGHWMYLDNSTPGVTKIPLTYDLQLINSGNPVTAGDECRITMSFENLDFYSVFGYVGDYEIDPQGGVLSIPLDGDFDFEGEIYFENPQFNLSIASSVGVPVEFDLVNLSAYSSLKDDSITFVLDENPYIIEAQGLDSVGYFKTTNISINNSNSNISDIIALLPDEISYSVAGRTNPAGMTTNNFITDSSEINATFEAVVPLYFSADGITLERTESLNLVEEIGEEELDLLKSLNMSLEIENRLPMDVNVQLYFDDQDSILLDSMFTDEAFLISPTLNAQDEVENPIVYTKTIELDAEKVERIKDTRYIRIRATISTPAASDGRTVKFFSYYDLGFKLIMDGELEVKPNELDQ